MPQLDFATFPSQLFWLIVNFALLYVLMARVALPRIGKILESRAAAIKSDLDRASELKAESERILAAYEQGLNNARLEARKIIEDATVKMTLESAKRQAETAAKIEMRFKETEARLQSSKQKAMAELKPYADELAKQMSDKLLAQISAGEDNFTRPLKEARG